MIVFIACLYRRYENTINIVFFTITGHLLGAWRRIVGN